MNLDAQFLKPIRCQNLIFKPIAHIRPQKVGEELENYHLLSVEQEVLHEFSHVESVISHDSMRR